MTGRPVRRTDEPGVFAEWQPQYAKHNVATFPVEITPETKKPAISNYDRVGLRGSAKLATATRFAGYEALGFLCGPRSKVTVVDMDDTDSAILREGERLFGPSPLLWQTGGGKFAAAYRFNGERRRIRPLPGLPIDLLGGGFVVAPPSMGARRRYEIIRGSLEDLDRLPVANIPTEIAASATAGRVIQKGTRNKAVFEYCRRTISHCDDRDQLVDAARTWADNNLMEPLPAAEVMKICNSVWTYRGGRKRIMSNIVEADAWVALKASLHAMALFAYLGGENGPEADFWIADGLAGSLGWPRRAIQHGRRLLIEQGIVRCVRPPRPGQPALYNWVVHPSDCRDDIPYLVGNPYSPFPLPADPPLGAPRRRAVQKHLPPAGPSSMRGGQ